MSAAFSRLFGSEPTRNISLIVGSSVAATLAVLTVTRLALRSTPKKIVPSPRKTVLPKLLAAEQATLPYPPDVYPGARDVDSPYGSVRVYEWGPEDGRKVVLLHGISTPCVSLGGIAEGLVEKGCRVILIDLFGRGYSDSSDLPHDSRLYTTEILLAITSSPLAWTPEGFSLVGYSLGGGIATDFASYFPHLVKAVVLLAPAGLIRSYHFGWQSRLLYSPMIPESWLMWAVRRRLKGASQQSSVPKEGNTEKAVSAEIKGNRDPSFESAPLSKNRPRVTVADAVQWQIDNHEGFVRSFMSSIKNASIEGRQETWRKLGKREDKVLIIAGKMDSVIVPRELREDAEEAAGSEKVEWREIEGGHEFPITRAEDVVREISGVWRI